MKQAIWTQTYPINSLVLNAQKRLGLYGLLNILQDVAWIHAQHLGHGFDDMKERRTLWVLTRSRVVMDDWPVWGDEIVLSTWIRPLSGLLANRDYRVERNGRVLCQGTSSWLTMDWDTRKPAKLDAAKNPMECRADGGVLDIEPPRIAAADGLATLARFLVRNSDLDVNGHVNNTRYAQWVLDAIPTETAETSLLTEYEANFLAETHVGDDIAIEYQALEPTDRSPSRSLFQGRRTSDGKVVFTARLGARPISA